MKKTLKKGLAYLLAVSMIITYMPATTFALEGAAVDPGAGNSVASAEAEAAQADTGPVSLEATVDGITVTAEAEAGVLPEGASMEVTPLDEEELAGYAETVEADLEDEVLDGPAAVELKFLDGEGEEIQPDGDVDITISGDSFEGRADGLNVYFFDKDKKYEPLTSEAKGTSAVKTTWNQPGVYLVAGTKAREVETAPASDEALASPSGRGGSDEVADGEGDEAAEADDESHQPAESVAAEEPAPAEAEAPKAMSFVGQSDNGVNVFVDAPAGAFPAGTEMKVKSVNADQVIGAVSEAVEGNVKTVKAVDITFYSEGEEIEPAAPVNVKLLTTGMKKDSDKQVFHMEGETAQPMAEAKTTGVVTTANFDSDAFSVYVVVESVVPRLKVEFKNHDGTEIATMYIKSDDTLEEVDAIIHDPGVGTLDDGMLFKGWTTDQNYTTASAMKSIEKVREDALTTVSGLTTQDATVTYYPAIFGSYTVTYNSDDNNPITLGTAAVIYPSYGNGEAQYTVNMGYTVDDSHNFEGWMALDNDSQSNIKNYPEGATHEGEGTDAVHYYVNGTNITVTGDVTFTVKAPEGHWLIFDENGKGGKYNAPQFVLTDGTTSEPCADDDMTRYGYTFDGWYYFPDGVTPPAQDAHKSRDLTNALPYTFGGTLDKNTTIYAKWTPKQNAAYTVIFWTQNLERDGYEVADSIAFTNGTVGETIPYTVVENDDEDYVSGFGMKANSAYPNNPQHPAQIDRGHFIGFCLKDADKNQQIEITPEGDAVLNLHYDRIVYNFKFYLYRESGNGTNRYTYGNNSGSGSTLNDLVSWHSGSSNHPSASAYTIQTETHRFNNTNYTYHYFTIQAYYGQNISEIWPSYDKIQGADGREPVSYVMMVGTKLKPRATTSGSGTVKGTITVLDENLLGVSNDANGNYVMVRFPNSYYNWRYHIWLETIEGEDYTGKTTRTYNGKTYYEETVMEVRSSNTEVSSQNEPTYPGFDFLTKAGDNNNHTGFSGSNYWQTTEGERPNQITCYNLNFIYDRQKYNISYFDGNYVDGRENFIQNRSSHLLQESGEIGQGATIPMDYRDYTPTLPEGEKGYVFEGWFLDEGCTTPYTWNKMTVGGIKVYAKWRQIQYRAFLHTNVPTSDASLSWGSESQALSFRVDYNDTVSAPTGTRTGYKFLGWYTDPEFRNSFNAAAVRLNEQTVTTHYDKTTTMTDPEIRPWEIDSTSPNAYNSDLVGWDDDGKPETPNKDRYWITEKIDLYAKWSKVLEGADGIKVVYTADGQDLDGNSVIGDNAPTDNSIYLDNSSVSAGVAAIAPDGYVFDHWVIETWDGTKYTHNSDSKTVLPGEVFQIQGTDAKITVAGSDPEVVVPADQIVEGQHYEYTVQLKAIYKKVEEQTPTHIAWYSNFGDANGGKGIEYRYDTKDAQGKDILKINDTVKIYGFSAGESIPERPGYTFKGWTKTKGGTSADFLTWTGEKYTTVINGATYDATEVAADQKPSIEDLYAAWEEHEVEIKYAVASDSTGMGTVSLASETVKVDTGNPAGSTASALSTNYMFDYWTVDDGNEHISTNPHYTPSKEDGLYVEHTYYAHFKEATATVTVHHYLKGTDTKVKGDDVTTVNVGSEYTAIPATTYQEKDLTVYSCNPSQTVTVSADGNEITIYYTLPLTITVGNKTVPYNGQEQSGYGASLNDGVTVTGLLDGDSVSALNYTVAKGTLVGTYTGSFAEGGPTVPSYYVVSPTAGQLIITDENIDPSLVVTKNDGKGDSYKYKEGETVTFTITVKNIYAEAKTITLAEIDGVTLAQSTFNNVAAGETVTTTATYTIKPADMAAGSFTNTVTATLEDKTYTASDTVNTEEADAKLAVEKTANPASDVKAGDKVTYTVKVTNSGNVTVSGITLADTLVALSGEDAGDNAVEAFDLAPGAKKDDITYTYTVTQADVDAGKIDNTATATGKDPNKKDVTGTASATVTTVEADAELTVTKNASPAENVKAGDTVTYTVVVKNTGNVTVKGIAVADAKMAEAPAAFDLVPEVKDEQGNVTNAKDSSKTITYTYQATQADVDAGKIDNTATATGKDPNKKDVTGTASATVTTVDAAGALTVTKNASPAENVKAGDTVTYTVVVKNTGNVTVKGIAVADAKMAEAPAAFDLVPEVKDEQGNVTNAKDSSKTITYTYQATQADVDAGKIDNTATATGKDPNKKDVTGTASATVTTVDAAGALTVTKNASPAENVKAGDTVTYTVVVKNTGNVTVKGIAVADAKMAEAPAAFDLVPEVKDEQGNVTNAKDSSKTITYTYQATQADVDAGKIDNTATATGKDPNKKDVTGTASATVTTVEADAELTVTKNASPAENVKAGDTVTYTVVVKNTGNVTVKGIAVADAKMAEAPAAFDLVPEVKDEQGNVTNAKDSSKTITYTYQATQADVDAGKIDNTATATGKDPNKKDVTGTASATVTTVDAAGALTVTKNASPAENVKAGDTVTYTVVVKNTGNVTVKGIAVADAKMAEAPAAFDLVPEVKDEQGNVTNAKDSSKTITYTYQATQADVDAGKIDNTATATGKDPNKKDVTGTASATVTTVDAAGALTVTKNASPAENVKAGDTVTYTVVVKNTGNVTVKGIAVADAKMAEAPAAFDLVPEVKDEQGNVTNAKDSSKTITYTYQATQADVDAGKIDNTATATGKDPNKKDVTGTASATVTTVDAAGALTVTKNASKTVGAAVGDIITYTVTVVNSGNVTIKGIALEDTLVELDEEVFDLAPAIKDAEGNITNAADALKTITYTYTVIQANIDAGKIDNTATATGKDPNKKDVTGTASATVTTVEADAELTVTKNASPAENVKAGDTVTYTVVVKNTGNVTVKGIAVADAKMAEAPAAFDLVPEVKDEQGNVTNAKDSSKTITYTYQATQADVDAGKIDNTATATGKDPNKKDVTGTASATVTTVDAAGALTVTKNASKTVGAAVGDIITYTVTVVNSGNVTIKGIALEDTLVELDEEVFDLAPAIKDAEGNITNAADALKTITYTYTVIQANIDAGKIDNTATATGKDPNKKDVTGTASATVTTVDAAGALTVTKNASPAENVKAGDTVTYTVVVKNTGNVTVKGIAVADAKMAEAPAAFDLVPEVKDEQGNVTNAKDSSKTITYTYQATQADVDAGKIDNTATATGKDPNKKDVTGTASATVTTVDAAGALTVTKNASPAENVKAGDTVTYTVVVKNTGNVTVKGIAVADAKMAEAPAAFDLVPEVKDEQGNVTNAKDSSKTITYTYQATQADVDAGKIDNTATATGKDPNKKDVTGTASATVTTVDAAGALTVTKNASPAENVKAGDTVTYTVVVKNTGNVTVKGIAVADAKMAEAPAAFDLVPEVKDEQGNVTNAKDSSKTITYTYQATQADVDAGKIDNTATATGKDPNKKDVTGTASATVTTVDAAGALTVTKNASPAENVKAGDTVTYTVVVKNTGNVTVKGIAVADAKMAEAPAAFDLVPEVKDEQGNVTNAKDSSKTITYTYQATQADVDAGKIDNTATATGKDPNKKDVTGTASATVTTVEADAELTVTKNASPAENVKAGDTVTYTVVVKNTGNVTVKGIAVADAKMAEAPAAFDLVPEVKDEQGNVTNAKDSSKTITYTYQATQADVDAGKIDNTATATGKDPNKKDVTGTASATVTTVDAAGALTVTKNASKTVGAAVGDIITYTVTVVNSGNVTIKGIALEDTLVELDEEVFDLAPAIKDAEGNITNAADALKTITYTYTVIQANIDAGKIDNTATATGKDPNKKDVTGTASATVTTVEADAELTVTKNASPAENVKAGDTVTYTVVVKNTGNVTVKGIAVADAKMAEAPAAFDLVPEVKDEQGNVTNAKDSSKTITYTYQATQADVDAGKIDNTATATGKDPNKKDVTGTASATVTTVDAAGALTVTKNASKTVGAAVGDIITYTVTVVNSGNVTIKGIALEDTLVELDEEVFDLAPAIKDAEGNITNAADALKTITYTYTVIQANIDAGKIDNTATATGKDPNKKDVTGTASATVTTVEADAELTVTKNASPAENVKAGDTVTYTVVVKNTGNVTVKGIAVADAKMAEAPAAFDLVPEVKDEQGNVTNAKDSSKTITYTYQATQADVDAGKIDNTATATGKDPKNNNVTASDDATVTTVAADAKLKVEKTADKSTYSEVNETITYTIAVKNTGNVTVSGLTLTDELAGIQLGALDKTTIAPGETATAKATYNVKSSDLDLAKLSIVNNASISGKDPKNNEVSAKDSFTVDRDTIGGKDDPTDPDNPHEPTPDNIPDKYQVLVNYVAADNGRITGKKFEVFTAEKVADEYANKVTVESTGSTAEGNEGYAFDFWSTNGKDNSLDGKYKFGEVDGGSIITITANFDVDMKGDPEDPEHKGDDIPDKYQVLVKYTAGDGGSVTGTVEVFTLTDEDGNYTQKGDVTAEGSTATANTGYRFDKWTIEYNSTTINSPATGPITFEQVPGNSTIEVKAVFQRSGGGDDPTPVPDDPVPLDLTTDHYAYVEGYPDGMVKPEGKITRAETATMIYRLLTVDRRDEVFTNQNNYSDVEQKHWYNKAVSSMTNGEYINGYPDGTFKGGNSITRAEFVTILVRFLDGPKDGDSPFSDIKGHWAEGYINRAVQAGWIDGYPDGTFQPDKEISRAEAMKIINSVLHRGVNENSELGDYINFPDNSNASEWYYFEIIEAVNDHECEGERPDENWTSNQCEFEYDIDKYERP